MPDIIERGAMIWPKAIGIDATILGVSFLKYTAKEERIIDPFCGYGTVLAVANYMDIHALGIDISSRRCRRALTRSVKAEIECIPIVRRKLLGVHEPMIYNELLPSPIWEEKLSEGNEKYWVNTDTGEPSRSPPKGRRSKLLGIVSDSSDHDGDGEGRS